MRVAVIALALSLSLARQSDSNLEEGIARLKAGRIAEAIPPLRAAVQANPSDPAALYYLGNALLRNRQPREAIPFLERSISFRPDNPLAHLSLGQAAAAAGDFDRGNAEFDRAFSLDPSRARPLRLKADLALRRELYADAAALFRRAIEIEPAVPEAQVGLGDALFAVRDLPGARDAYGRGLSLSPKNAALHAGLCRVLSRLGEDARAKAEFRAALEAGASEADLHFEVGALALRRGETQEAIARFREAIDRDPAHAGAMYGLGQALMRSGRSDEGRAVLDRYREDKPVLDEIGIWRQRASIAPSDPQPASYLALLYFCLDAPSLAKAQLDGLPRPDPPPSPTPIEQVVREALAGRWEEARSAVEEAGSANPDQPFLRLACARVLDRLGRSEESARQKAEYRRLLAEEVR